MREAVGVFVNGCFCTCVRMCARHGCYKHRASCARALFPCQGYRDFVIAVYLEHGEDHRVKSSEINAKKVVLEKSFNQSLRKETGIEITKEAFMKKYGNDKEMVKRAKYKTVRRRNFKTGQTEVTRLQQCATKMTESSDTNT